MVSTGGGLDMHVQPTEIVGRKGVFRITLLNQMNQPVSLKPSVRSGPLETLPDADSRK